MTLREQMANIGRLVNIEVGGLKILVKVIDFKVSYGKKRWLVTPDQGSGEMWVEDLDFSK